MSASDGRGSGRPGKPKLPPKPTLMPAPAGSTEPAKAPPRRAAALSYGGGTAPTVVAAGSGAVAERIEARAREHGVPVTTDGPLAEALARMPIDDEIPPELYRAVAEVLIWAQGVEIMARAENRDIA